ncbi:MAG TPA: site-specific DNA-methyltransferase, partial [bacterium]|nr:site-specific DNA-methyltransferase [bacterium]
AAGEGLAEGWFQLLRLIKQVGGRIIEFLAQIEDFQKMLWEKKKFITETFYVITVGNIPEAFYAEIAACEAQWEEWKQMLAIDTLPKDLLSGDVDTREGRLAFLQAHPSLPLDTRHFPQDFTDRLLASYENLDDLTDGLLVHSENWQALNLLQEKYRERVKCIYIDPPYNTGNDEFLYRDNYQHSSWLVMMYDRTMLAKDVLSGDGGLFVSIDYNEDAHLRLSLEGIFGAEQYRNTIIPSRVKKSIMERERVQKLNWGTGYLMFFAVSTNTVIVPPFRRVNISSREKWHAFDAPGIRPTMEYELLGRRPPQGRHWMYEEVRAKQMIASGTLRQNPKTGAVQYKVPVSDGVQLDTNWTDVLESDSNWEFLTEKNVTFLQRALSMLVGPRDVALDFFAGSGTTGHAVINLNREDGGRRSFLLVEMAEYFDTVLLPRIKKVTFTPEWKDGKPKRMATSQEAERSPRLVKVIRLESYEDALNNLSFDESSGQMALQLEDYLLQYMLRWETRKSETLLNVEKLQSPFAYQLHIHRDGETREQPVDLPETFNYLIGLDVETRRVLPSP